jgi:predicted alpha/beta-hydrolase family hydrolase
MERGAKRPDPPAVAQAAVRAAAESAVRLAPGLPLFAGGKSFGARMSSQAQAASPLTGVRGLAFLGFPLHPPGKPSDERARHLFEVEIPMLFLQGDRDDFAAMDLLAPLVGRLGARAMLKVFARADHSFHVPKRSGSDAAVLDALLDALAGWMGAVALG